MMKRIGSSSGFPTMFDDDEGDEEMFSAGQGSDKKRRLGADQVRALEKNFEVENKLDPERKVRLAQELGLQPRQVAVWFQNRRARWKTKQLERDYGTLKSRYDALRLDYDSLVSDRESLVAQVKDLKAKLTGVEAVASESGNKTAEGETLTLIFNKDGSSDSDSSAVLNDENTPLVGFVGGGSAFGFDGSVGWGFNHHQQPMAAEDGFMDGENPCSFFTEDQPPMLSWYCGGGWD